MTERDYTAEEMTILSNYERQLHSAAYSKWCPAMVHSDLKQIHEIHSDATGWNERLNSSCANCIYSLMSAVGKKYYAQREVEAKAEKKSSGTIARTKINTRKGK